MNGAQIVLECLVREKVECFFGYPGGVTLPFYDALYDHQIKHVLVRHEQNACFAAQGYARATGKVGVCCATSGPGATNLVTGLVDAHDGFDSDRRHHRAGDQQADRQRRVSGSRHVRHHALLHQAQLPGEEAGGTAADRSTKRFTSPRPAGPVRCWSIFTKDVFQAQGHYTPVSTRFICRATGLHRRPRRTDPARGADDVGSQASDGVRGRRHRRGGARDESARSWSRWSTLRRSAR